MSQLPAPVQALRERTYGSVEEALPAAYALSRAAKRSVAVLQIGSKSRYQLQLMGVDPSARGVYYSVLITAFHQP